MQYHLLYITCPDTNTARLIAKTLLEEQLIACANILGPITSLYRWKDALEETTEQAMLLKTTASELNKAITRVQSLHPYECPCIIALPITHGNPEFLHWITQNTVPPSIPS